MTPTSTPTLTPTERQIVELVCRGMTNPQIAAELFVEPTTVRWHLKNVFRKLGVRNRTELTAQRLSQRTDQDKQGQTDLTSPTGVGQAPVVSGRTSGIEEEPR